MNKQELIKLCRWYKGEERNPFGTQLLWDIEKIWVDEMSKPEESEFLVENTPEYLNAGLLRWNETDGTPYLLKALLFNRYRQWLGGNGLEKDATAFKEWYQKEYIR